MDPMAGVRLRARECHADALARAGGDRSAAALTAAATEARDLVVAPFEPGTRFAAGVDGYYDRVGLLVGVSSALAPGLRELVIAHELGHHELHDDPAAEVTLAGPDVATAPARGGMVAPIGGYSPRERQETAAEAFAAEFVCPSDWLRVELLAGRPAAAVAADLGLPPGVVARQALRALLLPPLRRPAPRPARDADLDPTQLAAAKWDGGPLLVEAGPGTGKTSTLVGRILHLLATGVRPGAILVLTFSNAAAAELRERVAAAAPEAAAGMWIGTIHAFGREVLHKWGARLGLPAIPRLVDHDGGLALLERHLDRLPLRHHRDLRDPAAGLAPVLRAIERCKDEMVTPEDYAAAARAAALDGEGDVVDAAVEFAAIYARYQEILSAEFAIDLGDLVGLAVRLLEGNDDVALHYGRRFRHVLVDEVQDVNGAATRLLLSLCGPGTIPWVVGDPRQSIYRFRGAHPDGVNAFVEAFGADRIALGHCYRSRSEVVNAFSTFAGAMRGGPAAWAARRGPGGEVRIASAASPAGEAAAVRDRIEELRRAGVGHAEQAVVARTHAALDRIGGELEHLGVPLLHLGDLFARPEVRDLLALLAVAAGDPIGLVRAATLPPFSVPRRDAVAAVRWAVARTMPVGALLRAAGRVPGLAAGSAYGLARLGAFLEAQGPHATAWTILTAFLLGEGAWLAPFVADEGPRGRMRLVAVHQLLKIAAAEAGGPARLLARVRRIAALGEGRGHGVVPPEGDDGESLLLTTIHAAKGREWPAVHVVAASARHMPSARRPERCPPPPDLARLSLSPADHDAEERALCFVALSRARDHLTLSHARRDGEGRDVRPSPFLGMIGPVAARRRDEAPAVPGARHEGSDVPVPVAPTAVHPEHRLRTYVRCPARYRHDVVDGLAAAAPTAAHRRARRAVAVAAGRLELIASLTGEAPRPVDVEASFDRAWADHGPVGHHLEPFHRGVARLAVGHVAEAIAGEAGATHHHGTWEVDVGPGRVSVVPDRVVEHPWGSVVVQVVGFARPGGPGRGDALHALLLLGARARFPDHRVTVEAFDAESDERHPTDVHDPEEAVAPYADAIAGIAAGRHPARPGPGCPSCPYYLVCGA